MPQKLSPNFRTLALSDR